MYSIQCQHIFISIQHQVVRSFRSNQSGTKEEIKRMQLSFSINDKHFSDNFPKNSFGKQNLHNFL